MVTGDVPLAVAQEMFVDPVGRKDVRVDGYAGNAPPENWAFPDREVIIKYLKDHGLEGVTMAELARLCNIGALPGDRYVRTYHIDSQEGLDLFVSTLKEHGLVDD